MWNRTTFLTLTLGDTPLSFAEASTGIEPVLKVLQTSASPLYQLALYVAPKGFEPLL